MVNKADINRFISTTSSHIKQYCQKHPKKTLFLFALGAIFAIGLLISGFCGATLIQGSLSVIPFKAKILLASIPGGMDALIFLGGLIYGIYSYNHKNKADNTNSLDDDFVIVSETTYNGQE